MRPVSYTHLPSSIHESLEEACMVHGIDCDEVLANIQKYLDGKKLEG